MLILVVIIFALLTLLIIGRVNLSMRFNKSVQHLFSIAKPLSGKRFTYAQLTGLPNPVQRYFKHVLKDGQPYISYVSLLHDGQFKTGLDKDWIAIKGEQYFTIEKPGFIWKGTTSLFIARDMFIAGKGRLIVSLLSFFNVVDAKGAPIDQGELLRWLAEGVWFPTNLLPSDQLVWTAINENTAKLTYNYNGMSLSYIVTFDHTGEITQMETKRYMGEKLETWIGKMGNYQEINSVRVPKRLEAIWRLKAGDFSYARFTVSRIYYDSPQVF